MIYILSWAWPAGQALGLAGSLAQLFPILREWYFIVLITAALTIYFRECLITIFGQQVRTTVVFLVMPKDESNEGN